MFLFFFALHFYFRYCVWHFVSHLSHISELCLWFQFKCLLVLPLLRTYFDRNQIERKHVPNKLFLFDLNTFICSMLCIIRLLFLVLTFYHLVSRLKFYASQRENQINVKRFSVGYCSHSFSNNPYFLCMCVQNRMKP